MTLETETGFGTGLRSSIERKQAVGDLLVALPVREETVEREEELPHADEWATSAEAFAPVAIDEPDTHGVDDTYRVELHSAKLELDAGAKRSLIIKTVPTKQARLRRTSR